MNTNRFSTLKKFTGLSLLAFCLFLISTSVNAQENVFRFGIKGGLNYSTLAPNLDAVDEENGRIGLHGGLFARIPLGGMLAIQPEVLFSSRGSNISFDPVTDINFETDEVARFNLNYVDVPVMLNVIFGPINIQAGPYAGYLLGANIRNLSYLDALNPETVASFDVNDFNRIDYGVAVGASVNLWSLHIGARYNQGLREIGNTAAVQNVVEGSRNKFLQAFIGVSF
jgi:hypothetical protein